MKPSFPRLVLGPTRRADIDRPGTLAEPRLPYPRLEEVLRSFAVTLVTNLGVALLGHLLVLGLHWG